MNPLMWKERAEYVLGHGGTSKDADGLAAYLVDACEDLTDAQREIERLTGMLADAQEREKKLARDYATLERHVADILAARNRTQPELRT
jgi:septal ring factor EnvC (AmiA/AmiB activator)